MRFIYKLFFYTAIILTISSCEDTSNTAVKEVDSRLYIKFTDYQHASAVFGEANFNDTIPGTGANEIGGSLYGNPAVIDSELFLPDYINNRVLVLSEIPTTNGESASFVIGQPDFESNSSGAGADQLNRPEQISSENGIFAVTDYGNHRILIFFNTPHTNVAADIVVGQNTFGVTEGNCSSNRLRYPESVILANGRLFIVDSLNNRVLIWNQIPSSNGKPADIVLGQRDFQSCIKNAGSTNPSANSLATPTGIWSDGTRIAVVDTGNNRVLIWNSIPSANFTPADLVIGQSNFEKSTSNDDNQDGIQDTSPSPRTLNMPFQGIWFSQKQMVIADTENSRVLIWNKLPTTNFMPADNVIGQLNLYLAGCGRSSRKICHPKGVYMHNNKLIIADKENSRYLFFEGESTSR